MPGIVLEGPGNGLHRGGKVGGDSHINTVGPGACAQQPAHE